MSTTPGKKIPMHAYHPPDELGTAFQTVDLSYPTGYSTSEVHRHHYYEIFIFTQGTGNHLVDFAEHRIVPDSIHFISPGQVHRINRSSNSLGKVLLFTEEFLFQTLDGKNLLFQLPFLHHASPRPILEATASQAAELMTLVRQIDEEYSKKSGSSLEIIRSYLYIFLLKCREYFQLQEPLTVEKNDSLMAAFRQLLEKNYREWHLPAAYADALNVTPKYLNEHIKMRIGKPVGEVIRDRIILEAKRLLYNSDMAAKEIAHQLHFDDPSYFSRFFKANTGESILEYRENSRKKYI